MSIQPVSIKLCSTLLEEPQEVANSYNCKGYLYKTAAIVCALALLAIFTGMMAIYIGMTADLPGWAVATALVAAMGCMKGLDLWSIGSEQFAKGCQYQAYADKYNEIKGWNSDEITDFFLEQGLIQDRLHQIYTPRHPSILALIEKSPTEPLCALLPLIARYQVLTEQSVPMRERFEENFRMSEANADNGQYELELKHVFKYLELWDDIAFNVLKRAILLQNMLLPTAEYVIQEIDQEIVLMKSGDLEPLGYITRKDPALRTIDYVNNRARGFFVRYALQPITVDDMYGTQREPTRPSDIRALIFGFPPFLPAPHPPQG